MAVKRRKASRSLATKIVFYYNILQLNHLFNKITNGMLLALCNRRELVTSGMPNERDTP